MGISGKIGAAAKAKGISLKELSRMIDVPYTTLYHAIKRDSKMDIETVQKIATALEIPPDELLGAVWGEIVAEDTLKRFTHDGMEALYGTTDITEARLVVYSRWFKKLSETDKDNVSSVVKYLQKLNSDGKRTAAERIEELAQIPKYQRQQDTPAGQGKEEPETQK